MKYHNYCGSPSIRSVFHYYSARKCLVFTYSVYSESKYTGDCSENFDGRYVKSVVYIEWVHLRVRPSLFLFKIISSVLTIALLVQNIPIDTSFTLLRPQEIAQLSFSAFSSRATTPAVEASIDVLLFDAIAAPTDAE
jgi:hypothetical protein